MTLPAGVLAAVVAHAREAQPAECCGLLIGRDDRVCESVRARNLDENPNRFLIDPQDHIEARRRARARGLDVIGFYHSHPRTQAYPSERDLAEASYTDCVHVIVSLRNQQPETRAFRLNPPEIVELPLLDVPPDDEGTSSGR